MMTAPTDVQDFLASTPQQGVIANLFTFTLLSGPVYTFTDWRRPISVTVAGVTTTYLPNPRMVRGNISVERGVVIATQKVTLQEANSTFISLISLGYFKRALYTMQRVFAASTAQALAGAWTSPVMRFAGRVNSIDEIGTTSASITIKSMMDDLDNPYPRDVIEADCNRVVFDGGCGLSSAAYVVAGIVGSGPTKNKLPTNLTQPDVYFTQGVLTFTGGTPALAGLSYMVKSYASGVIVPSMPFLVAPSAGDTFNVLPGCDNTLATCQSKYGYNPTGGTAPYFRGTPFVPDPTVTY